MTNSAISCGFRSLRRGGILDSSAEDEVVAAGRSGALGLSSASGLSFGSKHGVKEIGISDKVCLFDFELSVEASRPPTLITICVGHEAEGLQLYVRCTCCE